MSDVALISKIMACFVSARETLVCEHQEGYHRFFYNIMQALLIQTRNVSRASFRASMCSAVRMSIDHSP